ncbi:MAG: hypothetical protein HKN49_11545 [Gammaproteobacteria bacterium]|nr:hypothetical protein [Gammaproteobacteria bacterium]
MSILVRVLAYVLALLSIAAGAPKILQMEQELQFLNAIGLTGIGVSILGVVQVLGGVMLVPARTRLAGALAAGLALLVSAVAIFATGNAVFGAISLIPLLVLLAMVVLHQREQQSA